jgi:sarcosine oxidase subunit gamma
MPRHLDGPAAAPGVVLSELTGFSLVQVMARRGRWAETVKAAEACFGVPAPDRPAFVMGKAASLIWSGPQQFLALAHGNGFADPLASLRQAFAGIASLSDQSDGRCLIRLSGPRIRDTLAKICSLDLHDTAFPVGAAAATSIDHTNVSLWRCPDAPGEGPVYHLLVFTSFADSLWRTILDSAAEFGVETSTERAFS